MSTPNWKQLLTEKVQSARKLNEERLKIAEERLIKKKAERQKLFESLLTQIRTLSGTAFKNSSLLEFTESDGSLTVHENHYGVKKFFGKIFLENTDTSETLINLRTSQNSNQPNATTISSPTVQDFMEKFIDFLVPQLI